VWRGGGRLRTGGRRRGEGRRPGVPRACSRRGPPSGGIVKVQAPPRGRVLGPARGRASGWVRRRPAGGPVRAQPWATGQLSAPVNVMHHRAPGPPAIASARSRESVASSGPYPAAWPGSPDPPSQVASGRVRLTLPWTTAAGGTPAASAPPPGGRPAGTGSPGSLSAGPLCARPLRGDPSAGLLPEGPPSEGPPSAEFAVPPWSAGSREVTGTPVSRAR